MNQGTIKAFLSPPVFYSSPQAAIKDEKAQEAARKAAEAEVNAKVEAAKAALSDAADKLTAAAADASAELKDIAQAGFKSLLAGWEQAKKTFDEHRK